VEHRLSPELKAALDAEESELLNRIIRAGKREHFESLRRLALDPTAQTEYRTKALYALGRWGDPSVVPDLVRILPELEERERIAAIDALGRLGTKESLDAIAPYADDPSPQVRKFVVKALGRIGGREAESKLQAIARQDPQEWVRELAAQQVLKR
jgi:HEAT repeat protein